MAVDKNPQPETIRNPLDRILQNPDFKASPKQREFLEFVVNETLAGYEKNFLTGFFNERCPENDHRKIYYTLRKLIKYPN